MALLKILRMGAISLIGLLTACGGASTGGSANDGGGGSNTFIGDFRPNVNCDSENLLILDATFQINEIPVFGISKEGGLQFSRETILESACYLVESPLEIPTNIQLTILPNTIIMFGTRSAGITLLGGNIIADGTPDGPIYFTGVGSNPIKWAGIRVYRRSSLENIFDHIVIEHAGSGHYSFNNAAFSVIHNRLDNNQDKGRITFTNNVIRKTAPQSQIASYAFLAQHYAYFNEIANNTIYDNPVEPMSITVNEAHFIDGSNKFQFAGVANSPNKIVITNSLLNANEILDTSNSPEAYFATAILWQKQSIPYLLEDNIQVSRTILNIEAGAELQFTENAGIRIVGAEAALSAIGTINNEIIFTKADSDRTRVPTSSWMGIQFNNSNSILNKLNYTQIMFGGNDTFVKANLALTNFSKVDVNDSQLRLSKDGYGIFVDRTSRFNAFSKNTIADNDAGAGFVAIQALSSLDPSSNYRDNFKNYLRVDTVDSGIDGVATIPGINTPYAFFNNFIVNGNLIINAGAQLLFAEGKGFDMRSNVLTAIGEAGNPIVFSSLEPLTSGNVGYWDGLLFIGSFGSILQYVTVKNGGFRDGNGNGQAGIRIISVNNAISQVQVDNTTIEDLDGGAHGIYVDARSTLLSNNMNTNNIENNICNEGEGSICK